jgi:hypothetical protein
MAFSLFDTTLRNEYRDRLMSLKPDSAPIWGGLTAETLLAHLIDTFEVTFAEREVTIKEGFPATALGRWLILKLPLPRNFKAPPDFHQRKPGDFSEDLDLSVAYIERFAKGPDQTWGVSPIFGRLSPKQWGKLHAVHLRHHLKQFTL